MREFLVSNPLPRLQTQKQTVSNVEAYRFDFTTLFAQGEQISTATPTVVTSGAHVTVSAAVDTPDKLKATVTVTATATVEDVVLKFAVVTNHGQTFNFYFTVSVFDPTA